MNKNTRQFLVAQGVIKEDSTEKDVFMIRDGKKTNLNQLLEDYLLENDSLERLKRFLNKVRKSRQFRITIAGLTFLSLVSMLFDKRALTVLIVLSFVWICNEIIDFIIYQLNKINQI